MALGTRFGASQERIGCVGVCFSFELSFFFCFGMSFSDHCCVPRCSNRGRACLSLFSHGFSRSGELRKRWLLAIIFVRLTGRTSASPTARSYALSTSSLRNIFAFMLVPKEPVDSSITSSLKLSKARHFPKAGAVPSVFSFRPHGSQVRVRSTYYWDVRKAICLPQPSSAAGPNKGALKKFALFVAVGANFFQRPLAKCWGHSLSEAGRKQGQEVAMQDKFVPGGLFFLVVSGCTWKSTGVYTQCSVYARWRLRYTERSRNSAFLNSKRLCPLFFSSTLSEERCRLQLDFRESKSKSEESHFEQSQRHRRYMYTAYTVGGDVDVYGHLPLTKLGFLAVQLWPILLLKYSQLRRAMLQLDFRWSKPDEKHPKQSKTETRKQRFARRKHWNHI